jgi:hypothetical protein
MCVFAVKRRLIDSTEAFCGGFRGPDSQLFRFSRQSLEGVFSAPLCQAAVCEGACESAIRLLNTASEMRLLRHRSASLRDLPSAIFLR